MDPKHSSVQSAMMSEPQPIFFQSSSEKEEKDDEGIIEDSPWGKIDYTKNCENLKSLVKNTNENIEKLKTLINNKVGELQWNLENQSMPSFQLDIPETEYYSAHSPVSFALFPATAPILVGRGAKASDNKTQRRKKNKSK